MSHRARCRDCDTSQRLCQNEMIGQHNRRSPAGVIYQCPGTGHPAAGEPPCLPSCRPVGTIGNPYVKDQPHASTRVCDSPAHQAEAHQWVHARTGQDGVFRTFAEARAAAS